MFPLLLGIGAVAALTIGAIRKAIGPSRSELAEREKLMALKMRRVLSLDDAEDGVVLARRFGDKGAEVKFAIEVRRLKKKRTRI